MKEIKLGDTTVAILHQRDNWKKGLDFLTPDETFIQAGTWLYDKGTKLKAHRHIVNERMIERTQEVVVVMNGKLRIDLYDENNTIFFEQVVEKGDMFVILTIGHGYEILEDDTRIIEIKNGPFTSVEKDKALIV